MKNNPGSGIENIFESYGDILWGMAGTDFSNYSDEYKRALVFAVPYTEMIDSQTYKEEKLENLIAEAGEKADEILRRIASFCNDRNIRYFIPPSSQDNEIELKARFPFKEAAANAGIGWIGRNDLLITKKYVPRIRLSAILVDYNFNKSNPVLNSKCPPECFNCMISCPYKLIKGIRWKSGMKRDSIINYKECNRQRSKFIVKHSRKNSCGLCLVSCPEGI